MLNTEFEKNETPLLCRAVNTSSESQSSKCGKAITYERAVQEFVSELKGHVIFPNDENYENERRVWNGRFDRRPSLIVKAADALDVSAVIKFARKWNMPLAVRGAKHHPAGFSSIENGIALDLSDLKNLKIDPENRTARAGAGLTAGEFFHRIEDEGFMVTIGSHPTVGLTGFALGGGVGLLMGKYGLSVDNILSAEIVTGDGIVRTASLAENPDLFWAIRGGGGNFGVVTSLTFQLHPIEPVLGGFVFHPIERAKELLEFYRDFTANAPDELTVYAVILTLPNGQKVCGFMLAYVGDLETGERFLAPLRSFGKPVMDTVAPILYSEMLDFFAHHDPAGECYAYSNESLTALTDEAIETVAEFGKNISSPASVVVVYHQHGAASRVPVEATAYANRSASYLLGIYTAWSKNEADDEHLKWSFGFRDKIKPSLNGFYFPNLTTHPPVEGVSAAFGANYARLQQIKRIWDAENNFRNNANILPA